MNPQNETEGLISKLAGLLGTSPTRLKSILKTSTPVADPRKARCPKCSEPYRIFDNYSGDQSICPACADEALAPQRAKAQEPERQAAKNELAKIEAQAEKKRDEEDARTAQIAATAAAAVVNQMSGNKKGKLQPA